MCVCALGEERSPLKYRRFNNRLHMDDRRDETYHRQCLHKHIYIYAVLVVHTHTRTAHVIIKSGWVFWLKNNMNIKVAML